MERQRPTRELDKEVIVTLLRAADRLQRHFTEVLQPSGLTLQQYNVLRILRGAAPDPLPTLEIGERMIQKTPGVSRLLDRLEARDLVSRERCDEDRRRVLCSLTDRASRILAELDDPIDRADARCVDRLSNAERKQLTELLSRIAT